MDQSAQSPGNINERERHKRYHWEHREQIIARKKRNYLEHPERIKASKQKYLERYGNQIRARIREDYRENHEKYKAKEQRYYWKNREKVLARKKVERLKRREKIRAYARRYIKEHPEIFANLANRRRARLAGAGGSHTAQEWQEKKLLYGNRCFYCGRKMKRLTRDHLIPLSRGGTDDITNIIPACLSCNSSKSVKTYEEFARLNVGQLQLAF